MKRRLAALACAILMVLSFAFGVSALIAVEDETGVRYSDGREITPEKTSAFALGVKKVLAALGNFWNRYGILTVIILILVGIVAAIVISEVQREKKEKKTKPEHKKKNK